MDLPEREPGYSDDILHRPSVVREYVGLLNDLDDDAHQDAHEEEEGKVAAKVAGLSGDLRQYAGTSWSLTSPRAGGVKAKRDLGLGDATVGKRTRAMVTYSDMLLLLYQHELCLLQQGVSRRCAPKSR